MPSVVSPASVRSKTIGACATPDGVATTSTLEPSPPVAVFSAIVGAASSLRMVSVERSGSPVAPVWPAARATRKVAVSSSSKTESLLIGTEIVPVVAPARMVSVAVGSSKSLAPWLVPPSTAVPLVMETLKVTFSVLVSTSRTVKSAV